VRDLEGEPEQVAEAVEATEVGIVAAGDERADPHRVDEAVPGGLLEDEPQVVVVADREIVIADPAELHRLSLEALEEHVVDLVVEPERTCGAEAFAALSEQA